MQVIDSHVHFWDPKKLRYRWLDDLPLLNRPHLPGDYKEEIGDIAVEGIVFVQAGEPEEGYQEAEWVSSLDAPIKAIVALASLENGDAARAEIDKLASLEKVKGIRRLIQSEALGFAVQPKFVEGVQALADYDLTFDICVLHHQMEDVIELVKQCPDIRFVLDHCGKPGIATGLYDPWREHIKNLAQFENVCCKVSGLVTEAKHDSWTVEQLRPYIEHVIEAFGISRLMYGSDWSVVKLAGGYRRWWSALETILGNLSDSEKRALYFNNAKEFYGLD